MFALTLLIVLLAMRLPFVGPLAASALALAGLGACVLAFNDWRKSRAASDHPASHEQPPAPAGA
jgi:hypothetical protein